MENKSDIGEEIISRLREIIARLNKLIEIGNMPIIQRDS